MTFGIYLIGAILVIAGATYGMHLAHLSSRWIVVVDVVVLGLAILTGAQSTRHKDPA